MERVKQMDKGDTAWLAETRGKGVKEISALLVRLGVNPSPDQTVRGLPV